LLNREYVAIKNRQFEPTRLGEVIVDTLVNRFAIMETKYTSEMEAKLDAVAQGKMTYLEVVSQYDNELDIELNHFKDASIKPFGNDKTYPCSKCEDGKLQRKKGKFGYFWSCSNYENGCKCLHFDNNGEIGEIKKEQPVDTTYGCPSCKNGYLQRKKSKKGKWWWGCSEFKNGCKYMTYDKAGQPINKTEI
ncbi:MAG: topoisomerase DNA-binding C4 zinc finger domain-containing protein, partial [Pasteurella sp.]|nr:topoisomerase DNA-binding C4 zinc finger domain-containing protein [Pasteurella sp.]